MAVREHRLLGACSLAGLHDIHLMHQRRRRIAVGPPTLRRAVHYSGASWRYIALLNALLRYQRRRIRCATAEIVCRLEAAESAMSSW